MTTPVEVDDIVQGAVKWLSPFADVQGAVGSFPDGQLWLFQHTLWVDVEGSSSSAVVISSNGGWAGANLHNTLQFPRLTMEIYTDPLRDNAHHVINPGEAQRRIDTVFGVFDRHLHRPASETQMWGQVRTIACARLAEPTVYTLPGGDGVLHLQVSYAVTQG